MKIDFEEQVILITGATRGIGRQIADDFAELGAELILTGTNEDEVGALNRSIEKLENPKKKYHCVNFLDENSTEKFLDELRDYSRIDVCVNNAGINRIDYIDETKTEDWDDIIAVNLKAPFLITREISKIMKKNGYGRIVNISSIFGSISREKRTIYSSSKDSALGVSKWLFGRDRLGQVVTSKLSKRVKEYFLQNNKLVIIDASDTFGADSGNGHAYFRQSPWTSSDILATLALDLKPGERGLERVDDSPIWSFSEDYVGKLRSAVKKEVSRRTLIE